MPFDSDRARSYVNAIWQQSILPALTDYIRIPCRSPAFDPAWAQNGHIAAAVAMISQWCERHAPDAMSLEVVSLGDRTPVILMELAGRAEGTVLLYGHLDKQPEMSGWRDGLGPWTPVLENDRLYGRGGADDGYAVFASLAAILALQDQGVPFARCIVLIEACEESGSFDLPPYLDHLAPRIGTPDLVVCLDSCCGDYDRLWCTTSLRGLVAGDLSVQVLTEGVHSGDASGVVPSSFRVLRQLLERLEDATTGRIRAAEFHVPVPETRIAEALDEARILGDEVYRRFPFEPGMKAVPMDNAELVLNRTWRPALAITGIAGVPPLSDAGNVLRPKTVARLSLRIPPNCDPNAATDALKTLLERDPPYGARVRFDPEPAMAGWNAPPLRPWFAEAIDAASKAHYDRPAAFRGEGVSIPFMKMLGERFPAAQFLITGVLGPGSNAHGPNEFLHIPMAERVTCCVAEVLAAHARAGP